MKSLTSTAIVALTAAIVGVAGGIPAATAQQQQGQGQPMPQQMPRQMPQQMQPFNIPNFAMQRHNQQMGMGHQMRGGDGLGRLVSVVCSERGAERLEIAFVRLSYRLELTAEQQPLFEDLKSSALQAQTTFADACTAARPADAAGADAAPPDAPARLKALLAVSKARVAAMESVLPKFDAFYNSLTDAQKAQLAPRRGQGQMQGFGQQRPGFPTRPGMGFPGMMPTQPPGPDAVAPAAPEGGKPDTQPAPGATQN